MAKERVLERKEGEEKGKEEMKRERNETDRNLSIAYRRVVEGVIRNCPFPFVNNTFVDAAFFGKGQLFVRLSGVRECPFYRTLSTN